MEEKSIPHSGGEGPLPPRLQRYKLTRQLLRWLRQKNFNFFFKSTVLGSFLVFLDLGRDLGTIPSPPFPSSLLITQTEQQKQKSPSRIVISCKKAQKSHSEKKWTHARTYESIESSI